MEYSEKVMDHFMNPRNVGEIENASGVGQVGNMKCGDIMKVYLQIEDGKIVDAKFKTFGCGAAVATSSMATELVKGKSIQEALEVTNKAVMEAWMVCLRKGTLFLSARGGAACRSVGYAQKNNIVIDGLEPPVNDIDERHHQAE